MKERPFTDRTAPDGDHVRRLIRLALEEDIGPGDITSDNILSADRRGQAVIKAKEPLVLAGLSVAERVFAALDPRVVCRAQAADGQDLQAGQPVMTFEGPLRSLLRGERTALNFLQRLSGIATFTRTCARELAGTDTRLVDTRKTTPGLRVLEKYAVRVGGGCNHRTGLFDGVLIKDNHIAACGGIRPAVETVRSRVSHLVRIEVEASDPDQVREAMEAGADVIMLDNMDLEAVRRCRALVGGQTLVEVSGRIRRVDLRALAAAGADIVSLGALTHSAPSVDLSMQILSSPAGHADGEPATPAS